MYSKLLGQSKTKQNNNYNLNVKEKFQKKKTKQQINRLGENMYVFIICVCENRNN